MHWFFLIQNLQIIIFCSVWVVRNFWSAWITFLCMFFGANLGKLIIIFNSIFLNVSSILPCTLLQDYHHMDIKSFDKVPVVSHHHLHERQPLLTFPLLHCATHSWICCELSIVLLPLRHFWWSLNLMFCLMTHFFVLFAFLSVQPTSVR